jgi:hypothetical protein
MAYAEIIEFALLTFSQGSAANEITLASPQSKEVDGDYAGASRKAMGPSGPPLAHAPRILAVGQLRVVSFFGGQGRLGVLQAP